MMRDLRGRRARGLQGVAARVGPQPTAAALRKSFAARAAALREDAAALRSVVAGIKQSMREWGRDFKNYRELKVPEMEKMEVSVNVWGGGDKADGKNS